MYSFDTIDHGLLLKAVGHHTSLAWVLMYVRRWLTARLQHADGTLTVRSQGIPRAAKLTRSQVVSALRSARRHHVEDKADSLLTLLRRGNSQQTSTVAAAFAAIVSSQIVVISALDTQIEQLQVVGGRKFDQHPAAGRVPR